MVEFRRMEANLGGLPCAVHEDIAKLATIEQNTLFSPGAMPSVKRLKLSAKK